MTHPDPEPARLQPDLDPDDRTLVTDQGVNAGSGTLPDQPPDGIPADQQEALQDDGGQDGGSME
jgi:hypothetical protein